MRPQGPILLCAATAVEARACRKGIRKPTAEGLFEVLQTGMGSQSATRRLEARLCAEGGMRPAHIVSTGFAACAGSGVGIGTWVLGTSVRGVSADRISLGPALKPYLQKTQLPWIVSDFLSRSEVALDARSEGAVDMESRALAEVARQHGVAFSILRVVSDTPQSPIPECVASFASCALAAGPRKFTYFLKGCWHALRRPVVLGQFLRRSADLPAVLAQGWEAVAREWVD